ncbi:MAG: DUF1801 domain-containing protein [Chloroflexi bacterium]|nr:DUF1801 domain-containing protein [Chloroflexota bacterium]
MWKVKEEEGWVEDRMTVETSEAFEKVLENFDPAIQELARATRALIYDVLPQTVEVVWVQQKTAGYGTGPKKMSEHFSWIAPAKKHVVFGFYYGAELPDPDHLLEGTGKLLRHVKIRSLDDLHRPGVRRLLEVAIRHRVPPPKTE